MPRLRFGTVLHRLQRHRYNMSAIDFVNRLPEFLAECGWGLEEYLQEKCNHCFFQNDDATCRSCLVHMARQVHTIESVTAKMGVVYRGRLT